MRDLINYIVFGWYPYLCLTVFLLGSLVRFDREQYTWRSGSSQLLRRRQLLLIGDLRRGRRQRRKARAGISRGEPLAQLRKGGRLRQRQSDRAQRGGAPARNCWSQEPHHVAREED